METTLLLAALVLCWVAAVALMLRGWRNRASRQRSAIGELPTVPTRPGEPVLPPATGLYVGATMAPSWQDRIAVGDIGHRAAAELTRFERGILLDRDGAAPIWIPAESVRAVRTERGLAGKVTTRDGLLVIRWELPSGAEVDTGFRADDKSCYPAWVAFHDNNVHTTDEVNP